MAQKQPRPPRPPPPKCLADIPLDRRVPNTSFLVDACNKRGPWTTAYFVTHSHSDHTSGIPQKPFLSGESTRCTVNLSSTGAIFGSAITVRLLQHFFGGTKSHPIITPTTPNITSSTLRGSFVALPMAPASIQVDGVTVTLIDANHCPGAVMFLFTLPDGKQYLHTGDFRFIESMTQLPLLSALRNGALTTLFLDTTFIKEGYDFPLQQVMIDYVVDEIRLLLARPRTVVIIGSYRIGKEKIALAVAERLHVQIGVTDEKHQILTAAGIDMTPFSRDLEQCNVRLLGMGDCGYRSLLNLVTSSPNIDRAAGFQPTGWGGNRHHSEPRVSSRRDDDWDVRVYSLPYSEHSSSKELRHFVSWLKPATIVVTVDQATEREQLELLRPMMDNTENRSTMIPFLLKGKKVDDIPVEEEVKEEPDGLWGDDSGAEGYSGLLAIADALDGFHPPCIFDGKCYRTNPDHWKEQSHKLQTEPIPRPKTPRRAPPPPAEDDFVDIDKLMSDRRLLSEQKYRISQCESPYKRKKDK